MSDLECADLSALCQAATCGGHGTLSRLDGDSGDKRVPRAARTSAIDAGRESFTRTEAMWPSVTFTRLHCALTRISAPLIALSPTRPRIFKVSLSIFSSSPPMYGSTLSLISIDATPGYPAPEIACIVVATHDSTPKLACSGASAIAITMVEQFGFVTMNPRS